MAVKEKKLWCSWTSQMLFSFHYCFNCFMQMRCNVGSKFLLTLDLWLWNLLGWKTIDKLFKKHLPQEDLAMCEPQRADGGTYLCRKRFCICDAVARLNVWSSSRRWTRPQKMCSFHRPSSICGGGAHVPLHSASQSKCFMMGETLTLTLKMLGLSCGPFSWICSWLWCCGTWQRTERERVVKTPQ